MENKKDVGHTYAPSLDIETCLEMTKIPFLAMEYNESGLVKSIKNKSGKYFGIIISGSLGHDIDMLPGLPDYIINLKVPKLGICYGNELLGQILGSEIIPCNPPYGEKSEVIAKLEPSILFNGIDVSKNQMVFMAHKHMLSSTPIGSRCIASTKQTPVAGFENLEKKLFGLQFHPEKDWMGEVVFKNFFRYCSEQNN